MNTYVQMMMQLQNEYLMFPAFSNAHARMDAQLRLYRTSGIAQNLLITGESGTGKTSLAKLFEKNYHRVRLPERDLIPVLRVSIPPAATIAGAAEAILARLGDPAPLKGTISSKTSRAVTIAQGVGVEMLVLDESQHIQDRGLYETKYYVGDWLKAFMDALGIPVTMLGLPRTEQLLQVNEQLRRRFTHHLSLAVQIDSDNMDASDSINLLTSLASAFPIGLSPSPFDWADLSRRIHFATDSRIAYVKQLLLGAFHIAESQGLRQISAIELEAAFTEAIWSSGTGALNPFNPKFVFRNLDRASEPFAKADMMQGKARRRRA